MQTFSRWFTQDLKKPINIQYGGLAFMGDDGTPEVGVHVTVGGEAATLSGSAAATVIRPDGSTVPVTGGVVTGGDVSIKLTEACFAIPGRIAMALTITDGTTTMTVLKAVFVVDITSTDDLVDPSGDVALDVADLVSAIDAAVDSIPADYSLLDSTSNRYTGVATLVWEQGNINSGGEQSSTKVIRTVGYTPNSVVYYLDYPDGYTVSAVGYNLVDGVYTYVFTYTAVGHYLFCQNLTGALAATRPQYLRFKISDGSTVITPSFGNNVRVHCRVIDDVLSPEYCVTPQMFGAVGDGVTDDTEAFQRALYSGANVHVPQSHHEVYRITSTLYIDGTGTKKIYGDGIGWDSYILFDPQTETSTLDDDRAKYLFRIRDTQLFVFQGLNVKCKAGMYDGVYKRIAGFLRANDATCDYDIIIDGCLINKFYRMVIFKGRGFTIRNSSVTSMQYLGRFDWVDAEDTNVNHPAAYDQRALIFTNNRFHSIQGGGFVIHSGHAYGLKISDNVFDVGKGYLIHATDQAINWNISNNVLMGYNNPRWSVIHLAQGGRNLIISGNTFSADTDFWVTSPGNPNRWLETNGALINSNVCGNNFNNSIAESIFLDSVESSIIGNNVFGHPYNAENIEPEVVESASDMDDDTDYDDSDDDGQGGENVPDEEAHGSAIFVDTSASRVVINGNVAIVSSGIVLAGNGAQTTITDAVFAGNYPDNAFHTLT